MYFLQEAIAGGPMLIGAVVLAIVVGFALLACFIYWVYIRSNNAHETATADATAIPGKKRAGALPVIIFILLVLFIILVGTLLNFSNTTYE